MASDMQSTATPMLRFPEFRNAPVWDEHSLEDLEKLGWLELGRGNVISANDIRKTPGTYPVYSSSVKNNGYMGSYGQFMFDEELISWSVDGGGNFFHRPQHKFSVTNVSGYMRLKTDQLLYRFVANQLQSLHSAHTFDYQLKAHPSVIRKLYRLGVPSRGEQQKIADCLTSLDELIAAQGQKVEALKTHKRGLMQQLFPREGETFPRLRFPEFCNASEWDTVALGELLAERPKYGVNAAAVPFSPELPMYLRITDIDDDGRFISEGKVSVDIRPTSEDYLSDGDIALARTGASVGKSYRYREEDGRLVFAGFLIRIRPNRKKVVPDFVSSFLSTQQYWSWVRITSARSGQPGINGKEYASLPVPMPPQSENEGELSEQQRVAGCLSSLDTQITAESDQLTALKTHKQGLMQQLFPAPEDIGA